MGSSPFVKLNANAFLEYFQGIKTELITELDTSKRTEPVLGLSLVVKVQTPALKFSQLGNQWCLGGYSNGVLVPSEAV